ncbi:hypothetical protein I302_107123 [Kwoniella bestiolae CBS 10118]|uniref:Uncharacterized protein n=1 Tax=Kwoniella bestiolae CBS 10118 TaxID=1296100 RepID=A0A1B9FZF9_9TREE|nr:hypothetical protein I302_05611 [Kwoniella bestiolae CBS 10118]OCF24152.1 hypothetical protein I302_05611 [Kwoniella bestiolae CBS 10118]
MASQNITNGPHQYLSSSANPPRPSYWPDRLNSHTNVAQTADTVEYVPAVPPHPANEQWYRHYLPTSDRAIQTGDFGRTARTSARKRPSSALLLPRTELMNTGTARSGTRVPPRSHPQQDTRLSSPQSVFAASSPKAMIATTYPRENETPEEKELFNFTEASRSLFEADKSIAKMIVPIPQWLHDHLLHPHARSALGDVVCTLQDRDTPDEQFLINPQAMMELARRYEDGVFGTLDHKYENFLGDFRSGRRASMGLDTVGLIVERSMMRGLEQVVCTVAHSVMDRTHEDSVELTIQELLKRISRQTVIRGTEEFLRPWLNYMVKRHKVIEISEQGESTNSENKRVNTADNVQTTDGGQAWHRAASDGDCANTRAISGGSTTRRRQPSRKSKNRRINYREVPEDFDLD